MHSSLDEHLYEINYIHITSLSIVQCGTKSFSSSYLCITLVKIRSAALQKKEGSILTSQYMYNGRQKKLVII
jgi:hypothetical protein